MILYKNKYLKQRKKFEDSGLDLSAIDKDIEPDLMANKPLDEKYQDHKMQGRMKDYRDCHPRPDVVLIYRKDKKNRTIEFCDLDKHSNLFGSKNSCGNKIYSSSMTDMDEKYMAAVESGDIETAQRMVDEAAKRAGYDSPKLYHGTTNFGFTTPKGILFATDSVETAGTYSGTNKTQTIGDSNASTHGIYCFYANLDGMLKLDAYGAETNHIELGQIEKDFNDTLLLKSWHTFATISQIIKYANMRGFTGIIVKNVRDSMTPHSRQNLVAATDYVFFKPQMVKSADLVTYDNNGNIIPLSQRFNPANDDIRSSEDIIMSIQLVSSEARQYVINCAKNTRDFASNLVRVKSSNLWAYNMHINDRDSGIGDVVAQFKSRNGGPGDVYIYYDVPVRLYRRWVSSPSKGHFFWQYIRNNFRYSKLTGDKRGKLRNAVN